MPTSTAWGSAPIGRRRRLPSPWHLGPDDPEHLTTEREGALGVARVERLRRDATGKAVGIPRGNGILVERRRRSGQRLEGSVHLDTGGGQLGHGMAEHLLGPAGVEESLERLVRGLLTEEAHETVPVARPIVLGVVEVALGLPDPAQPFARR